MGRLSRRMGGEGSGRPGTGRPQPESSREVFLAIAPSMRAAWGYNFLRLAGASSRTPLSYGSDYHVPVMVGEVLVYLDPARGGLYLDGTLGGGGHAEALLDASKSATLIGVDRDPDAREVAGRRLARFGDRFRLVAGNFAEALDLAGLGAESLAGILLDLGVSSHQVDVDQRGFTFRTGAPLDMRMEGSEGFETAADLLNTADEEVLATIFYRYGEERGARRLARVVGEMRAEAAFSRSEDLVRAIDRVIFRATAQDRARIFQALRIAVNAELEALESAMPRFREALAPGGVMAILSYHSLEDRLVKDSFREWSRDCVCPPGLPICQCRGRSLGTTLTRKPVKASEEEIARNARARSARLRAWRKA